MMRLPLLLSTFLAFATPIMAFAGTPQTTADLASKEFKQAYQAMISLPSWVKTAQATSVPVTIINIAGKPYILGHMCRPHDCAAQQMEVVFAKDHSAAWGLLSIKDATSLKQNFLGSPDPEMQKALAKAYQDNNPSD
ncbi:inhibitor of vertebrate lysozyme [Gluconobacter kanchanaburiensis NBRC 103587]|uniref:Inhibitor of vertebrate lysozyme n=2 Tax=Gluconobacter kanchanaburiensis TaxID=563199 RepID=A0A511BA39_9PROT|nr:hypothetical protein AA103587_1938 [Gluconobacter kanchanaburiensis NBRC 103587]GEK97280.1 inhibitor of vertebrate lysozyme [Gluconobacter kanchanaburiensis NBRC 103587]